MSWVLIRGASNEYPQDMFSWRNKKDISIFRMKKAPYLLLCRRYHEKPQSQIEAYQRHQEEEQTHHDRQYTSQRPKKSKGSADMVVNPCPAE